MAIEEAQDKPLHQHFGLVDAHIERLIDASHRYPVNRGVEFSYEPEILAKP